MSDSATLHPPITLRVSPEDAALAQAAKLRQRLRLVPEDDHLPVFSLVADAPMVLGRSTTDADLTAQFRPRSNVNDGRTRRIGRSQTFLQLRLDRLRIDEPDALNPTLVLETPMRHRAAVSLPTQIILAGEYAVSLTLSRSSIKQNRVIDGWKYEDIVRLQGSLIAIPTASFVFPCQAALVVSDVSFEHDRFNLPSLATDANRAPIGRIHRLGGQFWWQEISPAHASDLIWLKPGVALLLAGHPYQIQDHSLKIPSLDGLDDATAAA